MDKSSLTELYRDNWHEFYGGNTGIICDTSIQHNGSIKSLAFHPTARILATCSDDGTVFFWQLSEDNYTAKYFGHLRGPKGPVNSIAFHPRAPLLVIGSSDNTVKL
jgi:WD40 repeat protein